MASSPRTKCTALLGSMAPGGGHRHRVEAWVVIIFVSHNGFMQGARTDTRPCWSAGTPGWAAGLRYGVAYWPEAKVDGLVGQYGTRDGGLQKLRYCMRRSYLLLHTTASSPRTMCNVDV